MIQVQQEALRIGRRPVGFTENYYTEWDDGLGKDRISMFMVLSVGSTQVPGDQIGSEAFQLLQDHFLNDLDGDPYERFENALREINLLFSEQEKELGLRFIPNVNVICGVIQKDTLFLSQRGESQGYLIRKRHVSSITDGLFDEKNTEDVFQNIASGVMEVSDTVILATGHLVRYVTPSDLAKIFTEQSLEEANGELKELLDPDLEDQVALLSFEVLEKTAEPAVSVVEEEEAVLEEIPEDYEKAQPLKILRLWAKRERFWQWLRSLKRFTNVREVGRDKLLIGLVVAAVLLVGGMSWVIFGGRHSKQVQALEENLTVAEENVKQAGTKGAFDKAAAAELLDQAELLAIEVLNTGEFKGRASQLLDDIDEQRDFLDNVNRVDDELEEVVDFSGIVGDEEIVGVQPYRDRLVVYTATQAYQVLLGEPQEPDTFELTERVVAADYFEDQQNLVLITEGGQVLEYVEGNTQFADSTDGEWVTGVDVASYSTRIYVLDSEEGQIWKYGRGNTAYGGATPYLAEDSLLDLTGAQSMAIDGSIWVLQEDGELIQLLSGEEEAYRILKAPLTSMEGANKVVTELDLFDLFVLDSSENRIFAFNKSSSDTNLTFESILVLESMKGELVDLFVDKDRDVLMIVSTEALYELSY